jgi:hypothetical protein
VHQSMQDYQHLGNNALVRTASGEMGIFFPIPDVADDYVRYPGGVSLIVSMAADLNFFRSMAAASRTHP